ncbi:MAG TPA: hypothetical protein VHU91_10325 [Mycobacteriales bacterium]|nr:hypothetical protein [Mycobacteriales bacterium]
MKIAATTLGETGGDLLAQTLKIGYAVSSLLFIGLFLVSFVTQLRAKRFHPALYWTVIVATSTAGTTMSDFINRSAGLGYARGAILLISCLAVVFVIWRLSGHTFAVERIDTLGGETLYWVAILFSNTLGTSLGDFLADSSGLGFGGGALVIGVTMLLILLAHYYTKISGTFLFWAAFVLTRPLGATVGDLFSKPHSKGGMELGTMGTSAVLTAILVALIIYTTVRNRKVALEPFPTGELAASDQRVEERRSAEYDSARQ